MLANFLTIGRIILIIPFCLAFYLEGSIARYLAGALFLIAALTDFLDGYVARRFNQLSALGAALDPVADKLLTGATLLMLIYMRDIEGVHLLAALIILLREILVTGLREAVAGLPASPTEGAAPVLAVTPLAKWKTACQFVAFFILICDLSILQIPGLAALWLAAALTVITGWSYTRTAISQLRTA